MYLPKSFYEYNSIYTYTLTRRNTINTILCFPPPPGLHTVYFSVPGGGVAGGGAGRKPRAGCGPGAGDSGARRADEGGAVPAHVGRVHIVVVDVHPARADAQASQQLAVGTVLRAANLGDAVQAAERARLAGAPESQELVRDHVHRDVQRRLARGLPAPAAG